MSIRLFYSFTHLRIGVFDSFTLLLTYFLAYLLNGSIALVREQYAGIGFPDPVHHAFPIPIQQLTVVAITGKNCNASPVIAVNKDILKRGASVAPYDRVLVFGSYFIQKKHIHVAAVIV